MNDNPEVNPKSVPGSLFAKPPLQSHLVGNQKSANVQLYTVYSPEEHATDTFDTSRI